MLYYKLSLMYFYIMVRSIIKKLRAIRILKGMSLIIFAATLLAILACSATLAYHLKSTHKHLDNTSPTQTTKVSSDSSENNSSAGSNKVGAKSKPHANNDEADATPKTTLGVSGSTGHSGGSLIVSPSKVTVQAGSNNTPVTVYTSNHSTMNTPRLNSTYASLFYDQLDGLHSSWHLDLSVSPSASAGTHILKVYSPDDSSVFGYLTLTVTPRPTISVKITQAGYDKYNVTEYFHVEITRTYGYDNPITLMNITGANCPINEPYHDSFNVSCSLSSKHSGTLKLTLYTTDETLTATAPFKFLY
jgi:hypothetical protein